MTDQPGPDERDVAMAAFAADGRVLWSNATFDHQFEQGTSLADLRDRDRRRMQALLANIGDTVTLVDAEGTILYTSGFHSEVLGYDREDWRARSILELSHPEDLDDLLLARQQVVANPGLEFRTEVRVRGADQEFHWVELTAVNLLDDPAVGGIVITTRNVSARKELEAELAERRDRAVEDARLRSEFVARVTHELRNQVHALHGLTELLGRTEVPGPARELAAAARREAEQLEFLVTELLDHSRPDARIAQTLPVPCELRLLVEDLAATGRHLAQPGVDFTARIGPDTPAVVTTDAHRLRQVLLNMISNATRFTSSGRIDLRLDVDGSEVVASLSDTGAGIEPDDLERIFLPFERAGSESSAAGTGLGLAISRRAVELLGGSLEVASEPGSGSTFTVRIPCETVGEVGTPPTGAPSDALAGRRVLVVEDTPAVQQLVTEQLRRLGAEPLVVGSGEAALAELRLAIEHDRVPDCVLVDWQLPGIDGAETTRRIRAQAALSALPIVGVSAGAGDEDRDRCLRAGMDDVLRKPVGIDELAATLARRLGPRHDTVVEVAALDELARDLGGTDAVRRVVTAYLDELDDREQQVVSGCARGDVEAVRRVAHTLRATSRALGALEIDRICVELETGPFPPGDGLVERFTAAVRTTRAALDDWNSAAG